MLNGLDVSHFQGAPNYDQLRTAVGFVIAKATQGTGYIDEQFARNRVEAHRTGLVFGAYHFAGGGDPGAEANHFADVVGALAVGEFLVLDWEIANPDPVGWSRRFADQVQARTGVRPVLYLNQSTLGAYDWAPVGAPALWLAKYDGNAAAQPGGCALKQWTDKGSAPGVGGGVDLDAFYGDLAGLLRLGKQPVAPAPAPSPSPVPPVPPAFNVAAWRANAGDTGPVFVALQQWAARCFPAYAKFPSGFAPVYGPATVAFLAEFAHRSGIGDADGRNIGPKIAAALAAAGFRP